MNVNLGCGEKAVNGCINVDFRQTAIVDAIHDLTVFPWPFDDRQFETAYAYDIIEHMLFVVPFVDEVWRILQPGGRLYIRTSYFETEQSYMDPTHFHYFTLQSFDFFDPSTEIGRRYHWYTGRKWRVIDRCVEGQEAEFELQKEVLGV